MHGRALRHARAELCLDDVGDADRTATVGVEERLRVGVAVAVVEKGREEVSEGGIVKRRERRERSGRPVRDGPS